MTFGIFLSTCILTSKQDLSVNVYIYDQNILYSNDSFSLLTKFQNKFQNKIKNFNQPLKKTKIHHTIIKKYQTKSKK